MRPPRQWRLVGPWSPHRQVPFPNCWRTTVDSCRTAWIRADLAVALRRALEDPERKSKTEQRARVFAESHFDREVVGRRYVELYNSARHDERAPTSERTKGPLPVDVI